MSEETRRDPAVWVLLPSDPGDLQYDMEPLVACLNEEAAKEHREADERVVRYVPEDAYREQVWRERFEVLTTQRDAALAVVAQARNVSPRICGAAGVLAEKVKAYDTAQDPKPLRPAAEDKESRPCDTDACQRQCPFCDSTFCTVSQPCTVKALDRIKELEDVLRYYADDGTHAPPGHSASGWCRDSGHRARLALGLPSVDG